jgi:hypothetical protein
MEEEEEEDWRIACLTWAFVSLHFLGAKWN